MKSDMSVKNKLHSELHRKYIELKRRITVNQSELEMLKSEEWDIYCETDRDIFYRGKREAIGTQKWYLNELHKECRELKKQLLESNLKYQTKETK